MYEQDNTGRDPLVRKHLRDRSLKAVMPKPRAPREFIPAPIDCIPSTSPMDGIFCEIADWGSFDISGLGQVVIGNEGVALRLFPS